jgi:hypothetical protein
MSHSDTYGPAGLLFRPISPGQGRCRRMRVLLEILLEIAGLNSGCTLSMLVLPSPVSSWTLPLRASLSAVTDASGGLEVLVVASDLLMVEKHPKA